MNDAELLEVTRSILVGGKISRARHEEMMRCVDVLINLAVSAEPTEALGILSGAKAILGVE